MIQRALIVLLLPLLAPACMPQDWLECQSSDPGCNPTLLLPQLLLASQSPTTAGTTQTTTFTATHVYIAAGAGQIRGFTVNPSTGALTGPLGPFSAGNSPANVRISSDYAWLFASSLTPPGDGIHVFSLAQPDAPAAVAGNPFGAGLPISHVSVTPDTRYVYGGVAASANVRGFSMNSSSGALTVIGGSPFGSACISAMHPDAFNRYLFVSDSLSNNVREHAINSGTGALAAPSSHAVGSPIRFAQTGTGSFLYMSGPSASAQNIIATAVNPSTGVLTAVPGSPFAFGGGNQSARGIAVEAQNRYLYSASNSSSQIFGYAINSSTGALTALPGSPYGATNGPNDIALSPDSRFAYVAADNAAGQGVILGYQINADGSLTAIGATATGVSGGNGTINSIVVRAGNVTN